MTIQVTQLRLNSNPKFANLTQLWFNSKSKFANQTQLWLNSFEPELSQIWLTTHHLLPNLAKSCWPGGGRLWLDSYPWFSRPTRLWLDSFKSESSQIWLTTHESSTALLPAHQISWEWIFERDEQVPSLHTHRFVSLIHISTVITTLFSLWRERGKGRGQVVDFAHCLMPISLTYYHNKTRQAILKTINQKIVKHVFLGFLNARLTNVPAKQHWPGGGAFNVPKVIPESITRSETDEVAFERTRWDDSQTHLKIF